MLRTSAAFDDIDLARVHGHLSHESYRAAGIDHVFVEAFMPDPRLQGLRRWLLVTRDMQPLYAKPGFEPLTQPEQHMQMRDPDNYRHPEGA